MNESIGVEVRCNLVLVCDWGGAEEACCLDCARLPDCLRVCGRAEAQLIAGEMCRWREDRARNQRDLDISHLKEPDKWMVSVNGAFCQVKGVDPWTAAQIAIRRFAARRRLHDDANYTIHLSRTSSYSEFLDFVNVLEKAEKWDKLVPLLKEGDEEEAIEVYMARAKTAFLTDTLGKCLLRKERLEAVRGVIKKFRDTSEQRGPVPAKGLLDSYDAFCEIEKILEASL